MAVKSVVYLGTKKIGFKCLEFLIDNSKRLGISIKGISTSSNERYPDYDLNVLANAHGITVLEGPDQMKQLGPVDYIISVQFNQILTKEQISLASILAVNLHMAPLPEYRGCNQFSFAILEGKSEFGVTLHRLEEGIDSGAIIAEKRFPIHPGITVEQLFNRTETVSYELFSERIGDVFSRTYSLTNQSELVAKRGTSLHFRKEINKLKRIEPSQTEEQIERVIRATSMPGFEPPHALIEGEKVYYRIDNAGKPEAYARDNYPTLRKTGLRDVRFGRNVIVYEPANLYECTIGDHSVIGPYTEIQRGSMIGCNTKVQSHAFICELVSIGDNCFISHGVMFINDTFSDGSPAGGDRSKWHLTNIGNRVSIGSNATILPVSICDDVVIGAGAVVTKNISEPGVYAGNPAKKIRS